MVITDIKVFAVTDEDETKAYVTIKLDDSSVLRDIRVVKDLEGFSVSMPTERVKDGFSCTDPIDDALTMRMIEAEVLIEYERVMLKLEDEELRAIVETECE